MTRLRKEGDDVKHGIQDEGLEGHVDVILPAKITVWGHLMELPPLEKIPKEKDQVSQLSRENEEKY